MKLPGLDDKEAWDYLLSQDAYTINEFGIGIVGIGALFFAYGTVDASIRELIAWIGLAGSAILWLHIHGAGIEAKEFTKMLKTRNQAFYARLDDARSWRTHGKYVYLYHPVTRLMTYFMGLVSWAWLSILLSIHGIPGFVLANVSFSLLIVSLEMTLLRKYGDIQRRKSEQVTGVPAVT